MAVGTGAMGGAASGAATGAAVGSIVPGVGTALGAVIGGGLGFLSGWGSDQSASAAEAAAQAELAQQRQNRDLALSFAGMSDMEMQQLAQSVRTNDMEITRKQKLLDAADPALIEAGHQALQLMRGEEAKTIAPLRRQLDQQRQAQAATLAQQLGPDWANSSAGIQAMATFDAQAADVIAQAQDRSLSQFLGVAQNTSAGNNLSSNVAAGLNIAQTRGQVNNRQIAAITNAPINPGLAYQGDMIRGAQLQQAGQSAISGMTSLAGAYMKSGVQPPTFSMTDNYAMPTMGSAVAPVPKRYGLGMEY